ncbi:MAG: SpoIID/LytB domain-containing protein [Acidimicrobiales bacterium]
MTENDTSPVIVSSPGGIDAPGVSGAAAVKFTPVGGGTWSVYTATSCSGAWTEVAGASVATPTAQPAAAGDLLTLCAANGTDTQDQGTITGIYNSNGDARTVNTLPLEEYVADVTTGESPSYWGTAGGAGPQTHDWGFQELEAQAVASRSYVLADPGGYGGYATTCDLSCQYYRGTRDATALGTAAADATAGQILELPSGAVAPAYFGASTGGYTAGSAENSPFTAVPDTGDAICATSPGFAKTSLCNPNHDWSDSVPLSVVASHWPKEGGTPTVAVSGRDGLGTWGGRVTQLTISGGGTSQTVAAGTFRSALTLKSDYFTITSSAGQPLALSGHGWGNGLGMGQWSALGYAIGADNGQGNWTYEKILDHFYSPATLATLSGGSAVTPPPTTSSSTGVGGYWLADSAGYVFNFGAAKDDGEMGGKHLNEPIVGMTAAATGGGYWLVASDGGIFTFGAARFYGSMGGSHLNQPVVGMAVTPTGHGYWEVASDGGIFTFGTAKFYGSAGAQQLSAPIMSMAAAITGAGYWIVGSNGVVFNYGTATDEGSADGTKAGDPAAVMLARTLKGYLVASSTGTVVAFGNATAMGSVRTVVPDYSGRIVAGSAIG